MQRYEIELIGSFEHQFDVSQAHLTKDSSAMGKLEKSQTTGLWATSEADLFAEEERCARHVEPDSSDLELGSQRVLLSIIMPLFNSMPQLECMFQSVLRQIEDDIELIAVDGGSTDGTADFLQRHRSCFSHCIIEPDNGWNDAFNKGVAVANGDYIFMIAGDDVLLPRALDEIRPKLNGVDCLCGAIVCENFDNTFSIIQSENDLNALYTHCSLRHPASFFRRAALREYDSRPNEWVCANDRERFLRFYEGGAKIEVFKTPIVLMRTGGISTASRSNIAYLEDENISVAYGMPRRAARRYRRKQQLKRVCLSALYKAHLLEALRKVKRAIIPPKNKSLSTDEVIRMCEIGLEQRACGCKAVWFCLN